MRWFRVNVINDVGSPSSATVNRRVTEAYMRIVLKVSNPTDEQMKAELARISREEKTGGKAISTTQRFLEFLISEIENKVGVK